MVLEFTFPMGNKENVKDIVFTVLTKEYPLRIIDLMNLIRKRYGKSVTFQAVRKSVLSLKSEKVLIQEGNKFLINKEWVVQGKKVLDELHEELIKDRVSSNKVDSIGGEVSVFTFDSLNKMIKFWQEIVDDWFKNFKKGDFNINYYQAAHSWEVLLHLDTEKELMGQLKKKGIKSYILSTGNTPLDKNIRRFYANLGIKMMIDSSNSSFDKSYYVGTYGNIIIQCQYPIEIVKELENFFKDNDSLVSLDLKQLSDIVNKKAIVKLTVIKNLEMAKQINKSILSRFQ